MKLKMVYGLALILALAHGPALADTLVDRDIKVPVQQAINTRQAAQKQVEAWDGEQARLVELYDRLTAENIRLAKVRDCLTRDRADQEKANQALAAEKKEALRIQKEILPFLASVVREMNLLVKTDAPFLAGERADRLARLSAILDDGQVSTAEKYRKTMEALFIEAEYGNTVEVYQEKIFLDNAWVLGNIFRLGRVSLFFLSLDRGRAALFDVAQNQWQVLDNAFVPAISGVVDMAEKHRSIEVISLPIGRLSPGGSHE
ncbi:MAG: DUF3450 domain-containing protein [Desulfobacter sp.]|nr:DUF3450 domain-containing protein [Desulfobacter sp.]WDP84832.1 MAG: DUF3450 domain-containing protein [Desulfobacter sp.]